MGSQIKWPSKRLTVTGIGNPLFVTDIENASEDLLEAFAAIYGFAAGDFAIVSGFEYSSGSYTGGIVYMNGTFYKCLNGLVENKYLAPDVQDVQNKIFQDANTYPTYRIYQAVQADAPWSGMPVFSGNMDAYRWSIKRLKDYAASIGVTAASDATSKANAAQAAAISAAASDATTKANAAQTAAASDATTKANAAQANAISAAASYAGAAQTNAINAAATDATNKANAVQAAAATDATTKANAAENNAKTYADGLRFVDGGDQSVFDFINSSFVIDGTWRVLDLTGKIPTTAKLVLIRVGVLSTNVTSAFISFRKYGNTHTVNVSEILASVSNKFVYKDILIPVDSNVKIEYNAQGIDSSITLVIGGYM